MRMFVVGLAMMLGVAASFGQTFVPRFNRTPSLAGESSGVLAPKSDLETSLGRVAEAPKLMPAGVSATLPDEPAAPQAGQGVHFGLIVVSAAVLALGTGVAVWLRSRTIRPTPPQNGHSA